MVIDEIGKMELLSNYFQKTVEQLFDKSERPIFATIPVAKGTPIPLVESLRRSHKCKVITVCITYFIYFNTLSLIVMLLSSYLMIKVI